MKELFDEGFLAFLTIFRCLKHCVFLPTCSSSWIPTG